jgi:hypothetical protein
MRAPSSRHLNTLDKTYRLAHVAAPVVRLIERRLVDDVGGERGDKRYLSRLSEQTRAGFLKAVEYGFK